MYKKSVDIYFEAGLKDGVVDFLLEEGIADFYYFECSGYSSAALLKSDVEQVTARREFGMFRLVLEKDDCDSVSLKLASMFKNGGIRVFMVDVAEIQV